jgi:non-specific serine/threonine protein kinase
MLETIREYALEQLAVAGEADQLGHRHAEVFLALAERADPALLEGPRQELWYRRLEVEHNNLRAALAWFLERRMAEQATRLSTALWYFWQLHGDWSEGRRGLERALTSGAVPTALRAKALCGAGWIAIGVDDRQAQAQLAESLALRQALEDHVGIAWSLIGLGAVARNREDWARATALLEQSVALFRGLDRTVGLPYALVVLGHVLVLQDDLRRAQAACEEALSLLRAQGEQIELGAALWILGLIALRQGDYLRAQQFLAETLTLQWQFGLKVGLVPCLENLAEVAGALDQGERAARLFGAAVALSETLGMAPRAEQTRMLYDRAIATAHRHVDDAMWQAAWVEGSRMRLDDAIALAVAPLPLPEQADHLALPPPSTSRLPGASGAAYPAGLTAREVEVLRLVAQGLSNEQVADQLIISPRTVGKHLEAIYGKLQVTSRSAATRFAVEHQLL